MLDIAQLTGTTSVITMILIIFLKIIKFMFDKEWTLKNINATKSQNILGLKSLCTVFPKRNENTPNFFLTTNV